MKGIEFRAWDIVTKRHYAVCGLDFNDDGKLSEIYLSGIQIDESKPNANVRNPSDVILEQYTGLKDKNGKMIYESDILWADDWADDAYYRVIYDELSAGYVAQSVPKSRKNDYIAEYFGRYLVNHCKVVGNIHQNPELLEEKDVD